MNIPNPKKQNEPLIKKLYLQRSEKIHEINQRSTDLIISELEEIAEDAQAEEQSKTDEWLRIAMFGKRNGKQQ